MNVSALGLVNYSMFLRIPPPPKNTRDGPTKGLTEQWTNPHNRICKTLQKEYWSRERAICSMLQVVARHF